MKIKIFLKWMVFIVILMMGLLFVAHLSLINPDLAGGFNQLMYRWRYFSLLWRVVVYALIGVFLWNLWKSGKVPLESQQPFKRVVIMFVLFALVSEAVIWINNNNGE
ncbi:hypothetical protein [Xenorhabdus griffiniae]|uniref:Uncharacterized protein n=1 Tax=Xenorhabdus griffiniae TaxID=351672 RepID=A0ABY9XES2_9GAMM|nr:hypothetical protein [Xenorhabdus griffiniae]MBD1226012.1 hypothetical protein [Xenorhabdus griffiniae]MBE8585870.1 hypothetical protein [Xenorhabdus griffiniae]WMV71417.1 hypothetical protein QL128_14735 [Xenorhabdus griffiniae]WNH01093.1 hypothetical protein QL112_014740 [Xenorhabdus griffiniae]